MIDAEEARPRLREAFDNPYTNLYCRSPRTGQTPGLPDRLVKTDPAHAATWFLDYGNAVEEMPHLGGQGPEPEAMAVSAHEFGDDLAIEHTPPVPLDMDTPTPLVDLTITEDDDLDYGPREEGLTHGRVAILTARTNLADRIIFPHAYSFPRTVRTLVMVLKFISIYG
jgi:hypothetical protein